MNKVCILLSTYNGEKYLEEQLTSLINQEGVDIQILVRDDGSTDKTLHILNKWKKDGLIEWYTGENLRPAKSFMNLLRNAPKADFYAFCDQDDVWLPNKLNKAICKIEPTDKPALYLSRTTLVDTDKNIIGMSEFEYKFTLGEAIVTNPATGCTLVLNNSLRNIAVRFEPERLAMHDEWIYKLCLIFNGILYADKESYILYRQHDHNVLGANESFKTKIKRRTKLLLGKKAGERSTSLKELFELYGNDMPSESRCFIEKAAKYDKSFFNKMNLILDKRLCAPKFSTMMNFYIAVLLGKF